MQIEYKCNPIQKYKNFMHKNVFLLWDLWK